MDLRIFLLHRLIDLELSKKELAFRLHISPSMLSRILRGDRLPPVDERRVKEWISALRLSGADAARWCQLVNLAHATPYVQRLVRRLQAQLSRANRRSL